MHPVERAQLREEEDYLATVYGLLEEQAALVVAYFHAISTLPLTDARAQATLRAIVDDLAQPTGDMHGAWRDALLTLYLGTVGTSVALLAKSLPLFAIRRGEATSILTDVAETRAATQAAYITQTLASDLSLLARNVGLADTATVANLVAETRLTLFSATSLSARADRVASTEAPAWLNHTRAVLIEADAHYDQNTWRTELDDRVRPTHAMQEGMKRRVGEQFPNGCRFPGDPLADISETIRCRCFLEYS